MHPSRTRRDRHAGWRARALALLAFAAAVAQLAPGGASAGPVNVNAADAATLARELHGIGPAKAQAIVAHRDRHGPFRSLEDLGRVRGIGAKTLERNRDLVRFDARGTAAPPVALPAAGARAPRAPVASVRRSDARDPRPTGRAANSRN